MKLNTLVRTILTVTAISVAMPSFSAGYLKLGDIKGEFSAQSSQTRSAQAGIHSELPIKLQATNSVPQAAAMTPEQAEELRKKIKETLKKPCNLNSNTPC